MMLRDRLRLYVAFSLMVCLGSVSPCPGDEVGAPKTTPQTAASKAYSAGVEALKRHDSKTAKAQFDRSLELDPKQTAALLGLAEIAIANRNPKDAAAPLEKAVAAAPEDAKVQTTWGHYLFWQ